VEHPHDPPPYPFMASPTFAHSSNGFSGTDNHPAVEMAASVSKKLACFAIHMFRHSNAALGSRLVLRRSPLIPHAPHLVPRHPPSSPYCRTMAPSVRQTLRDAAAE